MTVDDIKREIPKAATITGKWQEISTEGMSSDEVHRMESLRWAIQEYFSGTLTKTALEAHGLAYQQLYRAVNRCTARWPDGTLVGWRGLIAHLRVRGYERRTPDAEGAGKAGVFRKFLRDHPDIWEELDRYLLSAVPGDRVQLSQITPKMAHRHFLAKCDEKKLPETEWPYNTVYRGRASITKYVKVFYEENYDKIVYREFGNKARAKSNTGRGIRSRLLAEFPYDIWEVDEHKAHFIGSMGVQTPQGRRWVEIGRITIVAVVDRASGALMGYSIVYRREANAQDILNAIDHALGPWAPIGFTRAGRKYADGAGFPSGLVEGAARCAPAVVLFDNALSHLAEEVSERVRRRLGCAISYGAVARFERRPYVEGVFSDIERSDFMKLCSTTGTGVSDRRRKKPQVSAVAMKTEVEDCEELIETVAANHNVRRGSRNFGISPIDEIDRVMKDIDIGFLRPILPCALLTEAPLSCLIFDITVYGDKENGGRPCINYLRVKYTSPSFSSEWGRVGKKLRVIARTSNIRTIKVFDLDGVYVDDLKAQGKWGLFDHSLLTRQLILSKMANNEISQSESDDPSVYFTKTQEKALASRGDVGSASAIKAMNKLAETPSSRSRSSNREPRSHGTSLQYDRSASDRFRELDLELPDSVKAIN